MVVHFSCTDWLSFLRALLKALVGRGCLKRKTLIINYYYYYYDRDFCMVIPHSFHPILNNVPKVFTVNEYGTMQTHFLLLWVQKLRRKLNW